MPKGNKKGGGLKSSPVYKMKGSPMQRNFGISPVKDNGKDSKYPYFKSGNQESRSDTVLAGSRHFPGYDNLNKENKKKVKDATDRLGGYTPSLKEVYRQFKK